MSKGKKAWNGLEAMKKKKVSTRRQLKVAKGLSNESKPDYFSSYENERM